MGLCCSQVSSLWRSIVKDPDVTFGYSTLSRTIIRDKRLGFLHFFLTLCILTYIIVYQLVFLQQFRKEGGIIGTARMQLQAPANRTVDPAFCLGTDAANVDDPSRYNFPLPGYYSYNGSNSAPVPFQQGACAYLDAQDAVTDPLENGALLLPTRVTVSQQVASPLPRCERWQYADCAWDTTSSALQYVPDPEWFTLFIDHSFSALLGSLSRSSSEMAGYMVDELGAKIDPCAAYASRGRACPSFIKVGVDGFPDIIALQSLLDAVGVNSLDEIGGQRGGVANETLRFSGVIILLSISYSNFYLPATFGGSTLLGTNSLNGSRAEYSYRVSIVPNSEFKVEYSATNATELPGAYRTIYNRHGVRLVVTQTGRIGVFDIQTMLINLVVGFGLLAVANAVVDFIAFNLCPLRTLYSQYANRVTVSLSEILTSLDPGRVKEMLADFRDDEHLVDLVPQGVLKWQKLAAQMAADKAALAAAYKAAGGRHSVGGGQQQRRINVGAILGDGDSGSASSDVATEAPMVLRNRGAGGAGVVVQASAPSVFDEHGMAVTSSTGPGYHVGVNVPKFMPPPVPVGPDGLPVQDWKPYQPH